MDTEDALAYRQGFFGTDHVVVVEDVVVEDQAVILDEEGESDVGAAGGHQHTLGPRGALNSGLDGERAVA